MHYITGTTFTVNPRLRPRFSLYEKNFSQGCTYQISKIERTDSGLNYTFVDSQRNKTVIMFKSSREADKIIAAYRNEVLPDYDMFYTKNAEN